MTNGRHATTFAGLPVVDFRPESAPVDDPEGSAYRLRLDYDDEFTFDELFAGFVEDPNSERVRAMVIGSWSQEMWQESTGAIVESLVAVADRLPKLTALFLVDVIYSENEISWIIQSNLSPIWSAFPRLERFTVRGSGGLSLGRIEHDSLRELVVECGGLPREVLQQIATARLPELEHLELYLGTGEYGWSGSISDVEALLAHAMEAFPKLKYLGLRDSEIADAVAKVVAQSPILERIEELDLSLGTLGDEGGRALLDSAGVKSLKRLDLHYHFMSAEVVEQLRALPPDVNCDDVQQADEYDGETYRYVSVGE